MSSLLKCHQNWNVTKSKNVLKIKIKIKTQGICPNYLGLVCVLLQEPPQTCPARLTRLFSLSKGVKGSKPANPINPGTSALLHIIAISFLQPQDENKQTKTSYLDGVALFVADPPQANSTTKQNPLICNPSPYIGLTLDPIMRLYIFCMLDALKLDGVGPVDNKPSSDWLHHFVKKKVTCDTWHVTQDTWHLTWNTWHVTSDTWHMTCDI